MEETYETTGASPPVARRDGAHPPASIDYGPLTSVLEDPDVDEVMVNGPDHVWVERRGKLRRTDLRFESDAELRDLIDVIAAYVGRRVDSRDSTLDARLPDGSRVNVVLPPLSLVGPVLTIRRFPEQALTAERLIEGGGASAPVLDFLHACVLARRNIIISGRTGSGKTTLLNVCSGWIPDSERIISIEDSAELQLRKSHWVRMETRPADAEGRYEATTRALVRNSLRMRPDRIVIGEVRGGEAFDMLTAMNTGHDGSMSTIHASSPRDAVVRLETLVLMAGLDLPQRVARDLIASAVHVLVQLDRSADGSRRISRVSEIAGREGDVITMQDVFAVREVRRGGVIREVLAETGVRPRSLDAMVPVRHLLPAGLLRIWPDARLSAA